MNVLKNGYNGTFYVLSILPQKKENLAKINMKEEIRVVVSNMIPRCEKLFHAHLVRNCT